MRKSTEGIRRIVEQQSTTTKVFQWKSILARNLKGISKNKLDLPNFYTHSFHQFNFLPDSGMPQCSKNDPPLARNTIVSAAPLSQHDMSICPVEIIQKKPGINHIFPKDAAEKVRRYNPSPFVHIETIHPNLGANRINSEIHPLSANCSQIATGLPSVFPQRVYTPVVYAKRLNPKIECRHARVSLARFNLTRNAVFPLLNARVHRFTFVIRDESPVGGMPKRVLPKASDATQQIPEKAIQEDIPVHDKLVAVLSPSVHQTLADFSVPHPPMEYQIYGMSWLTERKGALLADEMGLGKSMQSILAARLLATRGQIASVVIIAPKSLLPNWKNEIENWWPTTQIVFANKWSDPIQCINWKSDHFVIKLINYELLSRLHDKLNDIQSHSLVIMDEAQRIKNANSKTHKAVKLIQAERIWALTGTPIENSDADLASILSICLKKNVLSSSYLKEVLPNVLLRRRLGDAGVDLQLPELLDKNIGVELSGRHRAIYDDLQTSGIANLKSLGQNISATDTFSLLSKLLQICNFCPETDDSPKLRRVLDDLEEIEKSGRKSLIFFQYTSEQFGLKRVSQALDNYGYKCLEIYGEISHDARVRNLNTFKSSSLSNVMLIQYKAGGVGLNIQAANYVFLFDRWWNPAIEDQAIKRAHRKGQESAVIARRLYCVDTIEEKIVKALERKRYMAEMILGKTGVPSESIQLAHDELLALFNVQVPSTSTNEISVLQLSPKEFEHFIAKRYEKMGYKAIITGGAGDGGIDIIAEKIREDGSVDRVVIQCKAIAGVIGPDIVRELIGTLQTRPEFDRGVLACRTSYSVEASRLAKDHNIWLIGITEINEMLAVEK